MCPNTSDDVLEDALVFNNINIIDKLKCRIRDLEEELDYIDLENSPLINDYLIHKPRKFKNLAHERGFYLALKLAEKPLVLQYSLRMGDTIIHEYFPVFMDSTECIELIQHCGNKRIELDKDTVNPRVVILRAMKYVPAFFDEGLVELKQHKKRRKIWYLEINRNNEK